LYWNIQSPPARRGSSSSEVVWDVAGVLHRQTKGWFGIGFPPPLYLAGDGHNNTDMIVAMVDPNNPTKVIVSDMWSFNNTSIQLDPAVGGQDNVQVTYAAITPKGELFVQFKRLLATGDRFDRVINTTALSPCMFAFYDKSDTFGYHGRANIQLGDGASGGPYCNWGAVNITVPEVPPFPFALVVAHGVLGALGIGLFLTFGAFVLRYATCLPPKALSGITWVLFLLGVVLIVISFIIAGAMVSEGSGAHFSFNTPSSGAHSITALVTFMAAVAFVVVHLLTELLLKPGSKAQEGSSDAPPPADSAFQRLAQLASYAILAIAIVVGWPAIFLGFVDEQNTDPWLGVIGGILFGVAAIWLVAEVIHQVLRARARASEPARPAPANPAVNTAQGVEVAKPAPMAE
jgi:hypothetical protein